MLTEQTALITILKEVIKNYEQSIEELNKLNNSALTVNKSIINRFQKDINTLIELDLKIVEDILTETNTEEEEKTTILKYFEIIKNLLKLNKEKQTTFQLSEEQYTYIDLFLEKIDFLKKENRKIKEHHKIDINTLKEKHSNYKQLLNQIEDENDTTYITNVNLLKLLFDECEVDEITKRNIMLNLMKYNQDIYLQENN